MIFLIFEEKKSSSRIRFRFSASAVISLRQNEQKSERVHFARISADRMQRIDRSFSSASRNMFLSNHVLAWHSDSSSQQRDERVAGIPNCRKAEGSAKFTVRVEREGRDGESASRNFVSARWTIAANGIARSIRRSVSHCVTDPGPCQFCCQFRRQFRCQSRRPRF